jgi:hypothetical protein
VNLSLTIPFLLLGFTGALDAQPAATAHVEAPSCQPTAGAEDWLLLNWLQGHGNDCIDAPLPADYVSNCLGLMDANTCLVLANREYDLPLNETITLAGERVAVEAPQAAEEAPDETAKPSETPAPTGNATMEEGA